MTARLHNIPGRPAPQFFHHVSVATGDRIVHVSGQVGSDDTGEIVEGGLAAQAERALLNVGLALDAAGAADEDLAKLTIYVVDWEPSKFEELGKGLLAANGARSFPPVPVTMIGVSALFQPDMLIEIEAVAVF